MICEIPVKKEYCHRNSGDTKHLMGIISIEATNFADAIQIVKSEMRRRKLQTIDPRIEWDEDFTEGGGWDYVDYSFNIQEDTD